MRQRPCLSIWAMCRAILGERDCFLGAGGGGERKAKNKSINQYIEFNVAAHINDDERRQHKMSITVWTLSEKCHSAKQWGKICGEELHIVK